MYVFILVQGVASLSPVRTCIDNVCVYPCAGCCLSQPCQNGGTCIDTGFGYECLCVPGFGSSNCDEIYGCEYLAYFNHCDVLDSGHHYSMVIRLSFNALNEIVVGSCF